MQHGSTPPISDTKMADGSIDERADKSGKKRKSTPVKWENNIIKRAKASGEAHRNHVGKEVIERRQLFVECRCKCLLKLNEEEKMLIIKEFNELGDHQKQNIYLRGCISTKDEDTIRRRNGLNNGPKKNRDSFVYTIKTIDFTINSFSSYKSECQKVL